MSYMPEEKQKKKKLRTAWRDRCVCPYCHEVIEKEVPEHYTDLAGCPYCGQPISVRVRETVEFLVLS